MTPKPLKIRDRTIFDGYIFISLFRFIYKIWFKLAGWKPIMSPSEEGAGITIAAPHTSNWDIFYALGAAVIFDIKIYFSIKESWCQIPVLGSFILWLGAIPINRGKGQKGQVALINAFIERHKQRRIFFLFTPEGTRGDVKTWKTGFYHIAKETNLPIFLAKVDYLNKETGVFHSFTLGDDMDIDIANLQESYKSVCAKFPSQQFPPYSGPLPTISPRETKILRALYSIKGRATQAEIRAKAKLDELSSELLNYLVDKGILERFEVFEDGQRIVRYQLTLRGNGCLLHLAPSL